jgi:outer membrane biosynthesis protein TonB
MRKTSFVAILLVVMAHAMIFFLICLPGLGAIVLRHDHRPAASTPLQLFDPPAEQAQAEPVQPSPAPVRHEPASVRHNPPPVRTSPSPVRPAPGSGHHAAVSPGAHQPVRGQPSPANPSPVLTADDIQGILGGRPPSAAPVSYSPSDQAILHDVFYSRWQPPTKAEVGDASPVVALLFDADGTIREAKIKSPSGIPVLDDSVLQAVRQVGKVRGLSRELLNSGQPVEISFVVEQ